MRRLSMLLCVTVSCAVKFAAAAQVDVAVGASHVMNMDQCIKKFGKFWQKYSLT